jgi:hypothetical protein
LINNAASGFQTILLLHTIVTFFQINGVSNSANICITPAGVQGINPVESQINTFHTFTG